MAALSIPHQRLAQQRLTQNSFQTPGEVVAWLGAVQAQDYAGAKWALGMRMQAASDGLIEQAFNDGAILRTHVLRPTWHFITPADIRWMLDLTAPRVNAANAYMYRQLELDEALFSRSRAVIAGALQGGQALTRAELEAALAQAGILARGMRLGYIVHRAELDALVCSGPRRGKQFTYVLLDERAPDARRLPADEALAELTLRYYTGHGPATVKDFSWWSGLTAADVRAGLDMVAPDLAHEVIAGQTYYFSAARLPVPDATQETPRQVFLLPTYDEFVVGYSMFASSRTGGQEIKIDQQVLFDSMILIDGKIRGSWRRTFQKGAVVIEIAPFTPLSIVEQASVAAAAQRFGDFLAMPVKILDRSNGKA
jgi:hypothetical protein